MNWHKLTIRILSAVFFFMTIGAIVSHAAWRTAPLNGKGSASFLFIAGALLLLTSPPPDRLRLLCIGVLGLVAEILGVQGGWLFGRYAYTEILAPHLFGAPLAMICAWFLLLEFVRQVIYPFNLSIFVRAFFVGLGMMAIDLVLDPVAANAFIFWNWFDSGTYYRIPLKNFVGWFVVSFVISVFEQTMFRSPFMNNQWALIIGASILLMYTLCAFVYGYFLAGVIGVGLICILILLMMRTSKALFAMFSVRNADINFR